MASLPLSLTKREGLLLLFAASVVGVVSLYSDRDAFASSEVAFTDGSTSGLAIVPASCPSYPHNPLNGEFGWTGGGSTSCSCTSGTTLLTGTADGGGYTLAPNTATRRISRHSAFFCVESWGTTDTYFIPASTSPELDSFRTANPAPTGVTIWGYTPYSQGTYYSQGWYYSQAYYESYYGGKGPGVDSGSSGP